MEFIVKGMTCGHCEAAVQRAVRRVAPQAEVTVERARDRVSIAGGIDADRVESAIRDAGYEVCRDA
jgi:copper chaperone